MDQLQQHCIKSGLLHPNHRGQVRDHDCVTAIGKVLDAVTRGAEQNKLAAVVMLDQTAAFVLVDHDLLLAKIKAMHFKQQTVAWLVPKLLRRPLV